MLSLESLSFPLRERREIFRVREGDFRVRFQAPKMVGGSAGLRKRHRVGSSSRLSSFLDPDETLADPPSPPPAIAGGFNDPATADVLLRLHLDDPSESPLSLDLHLHSSPLHRSRYFSALLSDRWHPPNLAGTLTLTLKIQPPLDPRRPFDAHVSVLRLLYAKDLPPSIVSVPDALDLLPVALHLLFDDLIKACVRFLEAVPWTDEEEDAVLTLIPFLREEESHELLARLSPPIEKGEFLSEEMLHGLILSAVQNHPKAASVKGFVAKLLRDYSAQDSVRRAMDRAFLSSLEKVRELLEEYTSPDFRVAGDNEETEALQRLNLHAVVVNVRHLLWLVERMIELGAAGTVAREWGEQTGIASDLLKTFREDAWKSIAPGLPALVMRCTGRIASAVAAGSILAPQQVRMKLVKNWLPVLNVCRDIVSPMLGHKTLYQELEETILGIISTLPMSDAQELLHQCLSFSTRNVDDCPHLISAFRTWFRRANRAPPDTSEQLLLG